MGVVRKQRSFVYCSPCGNFVIKVNTVVDAYPHYVKAAVSHSNNHYFPNVYWHGTIDMEYYFYLTFMEALEETYGSLEFWEDKNIMDLLECKKSKEYLLNSEYSVNVSNEWKEFIDALGCIYKNTDCQLDFSRGNFMLRGEQVVVIDPII